MGVAYKDVEVDKIENARLVIFNLLKETEALLNDEEKQNGVETERHQRLDKKRKALKYVENLVLDELRTALY